MKAADAIRQWWIEKAVEDYSGGLASIRLEDIDVGIQSGNGQLGGSVLTVIYERGFPVVVLKSTRGGCFCPERACRLKRIWQCFNDTPSTHATLEFLVPHLITIDGASYEWQQFVSGIDGFRLIKLARLVRVDPKLCMKTVMTACRILGTLQCQAEEDCGERSEMWRHGLLHNDLGPTNFLFSRRKQYLIDWEYAEPGPAIFNFIEATFLFGSLYGTGAISRRTPSDFAEPVLERLQKGEDWFTRELAGTLQQAGFGVLSSGEAVLAMEEFFRYKSSVQFRMRNMSGSLDSLWQGLFEAFPQLPESFGRFWARSVAHS